MSILNRLVKAINREVVGQSPRVTHVCGEEPDGTRWYMSAAEAVRAIDEYELKLFALVDNVPMPIVVVTRSGSRQLEIVRAAGRTANLLDLPECTWSPGYRPETAAAPAATPSLPALSPVSTLQSAYATARVIECISGPDPWDDREPVTRIGGRNPDGSTWEMSLDEAIRAIDRFQFCFYVRGPHALVPIIVATRSSGKPFLKARTDSDASETLVALPATLDAVADAEPDAAVARRTPADDADRDADTPLVERLAAIADRLASMQQRAGDRVTPPELAQLNALAREFRDQASTLLRRDRLSSRAQLLVRLRLAIARAIEEAVAGATRVTTHRPGQ